MALKNSSRRAFLGGIGALSACGLLDGRSLESSDDSFQPPVASFEYVGRRVSIDVFQTHYGVRTKTQSVVSNNASFLTLDASQTMLFAVNEIDELDGLPTGSVESFEVQPRTGHLRLISRRSLSLSATMPRHLAIAPDRKHMVVAVYGGGAYNVLPIHPNGELGSVTQIVKEIGCGLHPEQQAAAHPHSVLFHPVGTFLFGTDLGQDRINVFRFESGRMTRLQQMSVPPGSGPAQLALNPEGSMLFVLHELRPMLSCYRFDIEEGQIRHLTTRDVRENDFTVQLLRRSSLVDGAGFSA